MKARITLGIAGALIALTVSFMAFAGTPGAIATQGQAVIAGVDNTAQFSTTLRADQTDPGNNTNIAALVGDHRPDSNDINPVGVEGFAGFPGSWDIRPVAIGVWGRSGGDGVVGEALQNGVLGRGGVNGVYGKGGNGVYGEGTENGVQAQGGTFGVFATGTDYGVYASGPAHGVFGQATSSGGAGIDAAGSNGALALRVTGKAKFSRSGITTIAAGASSKTISLGGVTTASMVLATSQQSSTVFVRSAVPASGSFTIRLSGAAPTGGLKVAYFVLN